MLDQRAQDRRRRGPAERAMNPSNPDWCGLPAAAPRSRACLSNRCWGVVSIGFSQDQRIRIASKASNPGPRRSLDCFAALAMTLSTEPQYRGKLAEFKSEVIDVGARQVFSPPRAACLRLPPRRRRCVDRHGPAVLAHIRGWLRVGGEPGQNFPRHVGIEARSMPASTCQRASMPRWAS